MFFYATADVLITYQTEPMRVPDKYVMSVSQTPPGRLCSTAVHRCCRLSSTAVQLRQKVFHDLLPFLVMVVFQIEDLADAHRIGAFVAYHVADFCGQILLGMFSGRYVPADVVEC